MNFDLLIVSFFIGLIVYATLANTVFFNPVYLIPLVCGFAAGLFIGEYWQGVIAGFIIGLIINFWPQDAVSLDLVNSAIQIFVLISGILFTIRINKSYHKNNIVIYFLLIFILVNFVNTTIFQNERLIKFASVEPSAEQYAFDGLIFLKTFYLMKNGSDYYNSFSLASLLDSRNDRAPWRIQFFRMPTIFLFWRYFLPAGGENIIYNFVLFSLFCLISSFLLIRKFSDNRTAILAPFILAPYLVYGATSQWFMAIEYWGLFFAIIAVVFYVYDRLILAIIFSLIAVSVRELYLFLPLTGFIVGVYKKNFKEAMFWIFSIAGFILIYIIHYIAASSFLDSSLTDASSWGAWFNGGLAFLVRTMSFGLYYFKGMEFFRLASFLALIGLFFLNENYKKLFLAGIIFIPLISFLFIGTGYWGDYWGIIYIPFALMLSPLFLDFVIKKGKCEIGRS
ncbi:MAG: hypothetical protein HY776_07750 [Actinobacteria bacterium]|nr:hypothetical protein [Actinomycetota bacterium]